MMELADLMCDICGGGPSIGVAISRKGFHYVYCAKPGCLPPGQALHSALVAIFGAEPEDLRVPSLDHLAATLTADKVALLMNAAGGRWLDVMSRITEKKAERATCKDPGGDARLKEEGKT